MTVVQLDWHRARCRYSYKTETKQMWRKLYPEAATPDALSAHALSLTEMSRDLLHLLAIFLADEQIVAMFEKDMTANSSREDPLVWLRQNWVESTATALLVETAVKTRWKDDAWGRRAAGVRTWQANADRWWPRYGRTMVQGRGRLATPNPDLHKACDKIIHADTIEPVFTEIGGRPPTLSAVVQTIGRRGDETWTTELDIRNYVRASLFNTYGGIDFPRQ